MSDSPKRRPVSREVEGATPEGRTPDELFDKFIQQRAEASRAYEESEKKLIEFVEKQVETMKQNLLFGGADPSLYELNRVLSQYETIALGLTSLYATVRQDADYAQEKYDDAYGLWFIQEREASASLGDKKSPSTREIDMLVRSKHLTELAKLKAAVIETDTKRNMVDRLCKNWDQYNFVLSTMSRNAVAEVSASLRSSSNLPMDLQEN